MHSGKDVVVKQLTTVINDWAKILDNRGQVDTFILDFEKAFDTPPHELLKSKLFSYGIGGKTLKWIDSFLCFRLQRVVVNGVKSYWAPVLSGVPQGTFFGPLLFSLYINDISLAIESEIRLFADDCVCYREIKDEEDTMKLQRDIDRLGSWTRKCVMRFQPVKCNMMQLTRKRIKKIHASFILDFEKAFDTPPHELHKSKLFRYGIGGKTLKWIDSFLCFRQQRVVVNGIKSVWAPVLSDVPQGTVLGHLLFSLYINDISSDIESEIRLFADDCVCYREIKDEEDTMKLQRDIDRLGSWARKWGMRFQPVKCNMMQLTRKRIKKIHASYTLEGTDLENVESIKYLGVTITSDLRWNTHVNNVCTKANRTLGFLRRNLYSCPQGVKGSL